MISNWHWALEVETRNSLSRALHCSHRWISRPCFIPSSGQVRALPESCPQTCRLSHLPRTGLHFPPFSSFRHHLHSPGGTRPLWLVSMDRGVKEQSRRKESKRLSTPHPPSVTLGPSGCQAWASPQLEEMEKVGVRESQVILFVFLIIELEILITEMGLFLCLTTEDWKSSEMCPKLHSIGGKEIAYHMGFQSHWEKESSWFIATPC